MSKSPCLSGAAQDRAEAIVRRCGGGREGKSGWMVCCPAHEDRSPSLSVSVKGDKVLLRCFAGCEPEAIVAALALHMSDLFAHDDDWVPAKKPKPPQRKFPPSGTADPVALAFAVDLVIDDVEMLTVEGLITVLKQAASDPLQWLWLERAFALAGMSPLVVWQVLFPTTECPYTTHPPRQPRHGETQVVSLQGRQPPPIRLGDRNRE